MHVTKQDIATYSYSHACVKQPVEDQLARCVLHQIMELFSGQVSKSPEHDGQQIGLRFARLLVQEAVLHDVVPTRVARQASGVPH